MMSLKSLIINDDHLFLSFESELDLLFGDDKVEEVLFDDVAIRTSEKENMNKKRLIPATKALKNAGAV